jgi:hypothetical protein
MTDMRNFEPSNDIRAESAFVDSNVLDNHAIATKESYVLEDSGGLGEFHREEVEEEGSGRGKAISALIVALMLGAAGAYAYSMWTPQNEVVADKNLPQPDAPRSVAAMTPPPAAIPAPAETNTTAPTAPDVVKPAPVTKQANIGNAPRVVRAPVSNESAAPMMPSPTPQNQAATVPEPVSPTPPASALAGNPPLNEQSAAPAETPVTPTAPAPAEMAPAPAEPAPAQ